MSEDTAPIVVGARLRARFFAKVAMSDGCHEWLAAKDRNGYGRFGVSGSRTRLAHHVAWAIEHGDDPRGSVLMHSCDNPGCVNPEHLSLGTHADNVADRVAKGRGRWRALSGELHPNTKLTDEQVVAIAARLSAGETVASLAREYGVSEWPIRQIKHGKRKLAGSTTGGSK